MHLQIRMIIIALVSKNDYCLVQEELKVGICCGRCKGHAGELIEETLNPNKAFDFNMMQGVYA